MDISLLKIVDVFSEEIGPSHIVNNHVKGTVEESEKTVLASDKHSINLNEDVPKGLGQNLPGQFGLATALGAVEDDIHVAPH